MTIAIPHLAAALVLGATMTLSPAASPGPAVGAALPAGSESLSARDSDLWQSPVRPLRITRPFDLPDHNWLPGHRGVDLRAAPGGVVRAAGAGRVRFAGILAGRSVVVIDHGSVRTTYEPVEPTVAVGTSVRVGQRIGVVGTGSGHCGSGSCVHLGLRRGRIYLDPRLIVTGHRALLRPWERS